MGHDLEYLRHRGAFSILESPLLNELLRSYAKYVRPTIPAVELHSLLRMINQSEGEAIGLILLQAMMFTATLDGIHLAVQRKKELFQKSKACN